MKYMMQFHSEEDKIYMTTEKPTILATKLFNGVASDIRTRIVLQNEVSHNVTNPGMAGKVGLIGAFPSDKSNVVAVRNYAEFLNEFGLQDTEQEKQYEGMRAIEYLFMNNNPEYSGASSVVCVNTCTTYSQQSTLTVELFESLSPQKTKLQARLDEINTRITELNKKTTKTDAEKTELTTLTKEKKEIEDNLKELEELTAIYESDVSKIPADRVLTFKKLKEALHKLADEDIDLLFIANDLWDCVTSPIDDDKKLNDGTVITHIGQVYEYVLDFIENKFASHQPLSYVGWIRTNASSDKNKFEHSIGSDTINVYGNEKEIGIIGEGENKGKFDFSEVNKNDDFGAYQLAQLFTKPSYELATCGLFYQGATINGERVGPMELSAHICGFIASSNVGTDLTYQTLPGVTGVSEEVYFGSGDAGEVLNNFGIQIIKPKNRLEKTFFINNSVNPSGWHTNHVRSVNYLLKKFAFEAGLGINNYASNIAIFRASLEQVSRDVINEVDLIRSVSIGQPEVINNYHLYVPIDIILAGVITKISVGVSMSLDNTGSYGDKATTGYNFYY